MQGGLRACEPGGAGQTQTTDTKVWHLASGIWYLASVSFVVVAKVRVGMHDIDCDQGTASSVNIEHSNGFT